MKKTEEKTKQKKNALSVRDPDFRSLFGNQNRTKRINLAITEDELNEIIEGAKMTNLNRTQYIVACHKLVFKKFLKQKQTQDRH